MQEHIQHLSTVLEVLRAHQLYANAKKCEIGKREVAYLGHIISGDGIAMDPSKIQAILDWTVPRNLKELRGFLGLIGYYRCYIHRFAYIATPLTKQLKKDSFNWDEEAT